MTATQTDSQQTQRKVTAPIDLQTRQTTLVMQWLLENSVSHPITRGNALRVYVGGQEGFAAIAGDIATAKRSVDLICWGFDPGMALVRNQSNPQWPWAQGEPYGELLRRVAAKGVKVRLLVWYSPEGSAAQNSLPGYVVPGSYLQGSTITYTHAEQNPNKKLSIAERRQDYCTLWWRDAVAGRIANLEVRCRDCQTAKVKASIADEADRPSADGGKFAGNVDEKMLIEEHATHHQKPIVIDYDGGDGSDALGYVMGLNSTSEYWDSADHPWHSDERELDYTGQSDALGKIALKGGSPPLSRKPLRDYAARVRGAVLAGLWRNFASAWNRAERLPMLADPRNPIKRPAASARLDEALLPPKLAAAYDNDERRLALQVLRTQPEETYQDQPQGQPRTQPFDKSIKHGYFQASSWARNYLFLENQYFFYEEWARHLKACRQAFMDWVQAAGKTSKDARLLHLMVVIPQPEDLGMIPRTYDTLKSLGQVSDDKENDKNNGKVSAMPRQHALVTHDASWPATTHYAITDTAAQVKEPTLDKDGVLLQDGKSLGLKVLVLQLVTQDHTGLAAQRKLSAYRDIYIHSKLLLIDDSFLTLGSANMSLRSMAADSEFNVATDSRRHATELRQRVWGQLTGKDRVATGREGTPAEIALAFKRWQTLGKDNREAIKKTKNMTGFIVTFQDERTSTYRYG